MLCVPKSPLILPFHVRFNEAESTPTPHLKHRVLESGSKLLPPGTSPSPARSPRAGPRSGQTLLQHGRGANRAGLIESLNICLLNITVPPTPPPKSLELGLSPFHRSPKTSWLAGSGGGACSFTALKSIGQGCVGSSPTAALAPSSLF